MRRGTLRVAMTVLAVCALGACTGDEPGDPRTFPPYTAPASPTPTPTPTAPPASDAATPPERPDMSTVDAETAEAVAVYFITLFPYVYATGDLSDWDLLSHPECVHCSSVHSGVEEMFAAGNHSEGGLLTVNDVHTAPVSDNWWHVTLTMVQAASTTVDGSGTVVEEFVGGKTFRVDIAVIQNEGRWLIREVEHSEQP